MDKIVLENVVELFEKKDFKKKLTKINYRYYEKYRFRRLIHETYHIYKEVYMLSLAFFII